MKKVLIYALLVLMTLTLVFSIWFYRTFMMLPEHHLSKKNTVTENIHNLDQWLLQLHEKGKFNGGVLVIDNNKTALKKTYGYTDFSETNKLTNNTAFRLASVSKQFTAAGIMLLVEEGKLSYNDALVKLIPELSYHNITVRHLLNNTSGIPDVYISLAEQHRAEVGRVLTIKKVIDLLKEHPLELGFRPGEKYEYSNTNYVILAAIIEYISQQTFEAYLKEKLFEPLNMDDSRVWNLLSTTPFPNKAKGFEKYMDHTSEVTPEFIDGVAGDGAVFVSLNDFEKWHRFWYSSNLIDSTHILQAFEKPILNNGEESDYGFGWIIQNEGHWHNGGWLAANTYIKRVPESGRCIVILDNSSNFMFFEIESIISAVF